MHVISRKTLLNYWRTHPVVEGSLKAWFKEAEHAAWKSFNDVHERYPAASLLTDNRVVFNIKGNDYRLVVKINYSIGVIYIRFIGTHAEYNQIDAKKI